MTHGERLRRKAAHPHPTARGGIRRPRSQVSNGGGWAQAPAPKIRTDTTIEPWRASLSVWRTRRCFGTPKLCEGAFLIALVAGAARARREYLARSATVRPSSDSSNPASSRASQLSFAESFALPTRMKLDRPAICPASATRDFWTDWGTREPNKEAIAGAVEAFRRQVRG
jgi:hypothetical protein